MNDKTWTNADKWSALWCGLSVCAAAVAIACMLSAFGGCSPCAAQWGTRSGAVAPLVRYQTPAKLEWVKDRSAPGQWDLLRDGKMIGAFDGKVYRRLLDFRRGLWSGPVVAPVPPPAAPKCACKDDPDAGCCCGKDCKCEPEPVVENFGVDLDKLHETDDGYRLGGRVVSKQEAYEAIEKGLPDDAGKLRVTVIGPDEDRKRFEAEFRASDLAQSCVLWSVPPDHWSLKDLDTKQTVFKTDGKPTIYAQAPDGKVLWRQDDDKGAIQNLRRVDPKKPYDPSKDKTPNSPVAPGLPDLSQIPTAVWVIGGVLLFAFFTRRKETS